MLHNSTNCEGFFLQLRFKVEEKAMGVGGLASCARAILYKVTRAMMSTPLHLIYMYLIKMKCGKYGNIHM